MYHLIVINKQGQKNVIAQDPDKSVIERMYNKLSPVFTDGFQLIIEEKLEGCWR